MKSNPSHIFILAFWGAIFLPLSCKTQKFEIEERFVDVYLNIRLAETAWGGDTERMKSMRKIILSEYNLTPVEVHTFLENLKQHPEKWKLFFDKVNAKASELETKHKGE